MNLTRAMSLWQKYQNSVLARIGAIALSYPPPPPPPRFRVRVRATVKLSAAFFHDESSITIGMGGGGGVRKCNSAQELTRSILKLTITNDVSKLA